MVPTNKFLVLKLEGAYGFFKKPETTSSPISYYFPPRPTLLGMIGAMCGFAKDKYNSDTRLSPENCVVAISIVGKIRTFFYNTNTAEFSNSLIVNRAPTNYTYLKNPKYLVYVAIKDDALRKELIQRLENNDFVYAVSLGAANLMARVTYEGEVDFKKSFGIEGNSPIRISSAIPFKNEGGNFVKQISYGGEVVKTTMPRLMNEKREVTEFCSYIYQQNGFPMEIIPSGKLEIFSTIDNKQCIVGL